MSRFYEMDAGDWIGIITTGIIQAAAVIVASNGWNEALTPTQIGGSIIAFFTPLATYMKKAPERKK